MSGPQGGAVASGPTRLRSWLVLAAVLAVLLVAGLNLIQQRRTTRAAHPRVDGELAVAGLGAPLGLLRDRHGVPHVEAAKESDAWFALGFVHAQDRPVQLLWLRRAARGRLAEVAGESALEADRLARLLGIGHHADAAVAGLPASTRRVLTSYAAGVNARLERLRSGAAGLPPALARWQVPLEPWQPADSLALVKLLAWNLGGAFEESLVLSDLIQRFGGFESRIFFPGGVDGATAAPPGLQRAGSAPSLPGVAAPFGLGEGELRDPHPLARVTGLAASQLGCAWVLGGAHTRSGRPLLSGQVGFGATLPAVFYQAHLRSPGLDVAGATLPGVPAFWAGFNPQVAWVAVDAGVVTTDLFVETLHPRGDRYHDGRRWAPLLERVEEIAVRGAGTRTLRVRETRHGPLINPLLAREREPLALRWTGAERGGGLTGLLRVARARDAAELRRALARHHEPVLAFVYADASGEAGRQLAGYVPRRAQATSLLPVPARDRAYAWQGRIPAAELPGETLEEGRGFLVAADARLPEAAGIEWLWRPGERHRRARVLLGEASRRGALDLRGAEALQRDWRSQRAGDLVDTALALAGEADGLAREAREVVTLLRSWDRDQATSSVGAAAYHVFLDGLLRALLEPRMGDALLARYTALARVNPTHLADAIVAGAGTAADSWSEPARVRAAIRSSLRDAGLRLTVDFGANRRKWTWGRLHQLRFRPLWGRGGPALGPFAAGGDFGSLEGAEYRPLHSFEAWTAQTYRLLVDTGALDEALTSLAPGQSEHLAHPHRDDGIERWLAGRARLLATSPLAVEEGAWARLRLEPAP